VAVLLAADTAQTLSRLHAAGLAHGAFGPATTVLTSAGTASLVEVGLAAALDGTGPDQGGDVAAWAGFVHTLAAACGDPAVTRLLEAGADVAGRTGLPSALRLLSSSVASLPAAPDRARLASIARTATAGTAAKPADGPPAAAPPAPPARARTLLPGEHRAAASEPAGPAPDPADQTTQVGRRAASGDAARSAGEPGGAAGVRLRLGPGVPPSAVRSWSGGPAVSRRGRQRVLLRGLLSGLLTFGIASAVLGVLYWRSLDPLMVTAASVAPAQPLNGSCDLTVDVVGTVETNGRGGTVTYQWIRSDGQASAVLEQSIPSGSSSVQVHLYWSFSGRGTLPVWATLKVVAPNSIEATGAFTYACP
jgi:hypothetical protein